MHALVRELYCACISCGWASYDQCSLHFTQLGFSELVFISQREVSLLMREGYMYPWHKYLKFI